MRNRLTSCFTVLLISTLLAVSAFGQAKPAMRDDTGFTSYVVFGGTANSLGQVYELNSSMGYTFTQHFGMDLAFRFFL